MLPVRELPCRLACDGYGCYCRSGGRVGKAVVDVIAQGIKAYATAGAVVIGAALGLIFGPAVMIALGAAFGAIGAAVGMLAQSVGKLFGEALQGAKTILDDVTGAAMKFAHAVMRIHWVTGMTTRTSSDLVLALTALGLKTDEVQSIFGQWSMRLEILGPKLAALGVVLRQNKDGTVDWWHALSQLRQRWQELPEIMRMPYFTAVLGQQATQALLPTLHMPEREFRKGQEEAQRAADLAAMAAPMEEQYKPVMDRLKFIVQVIKIRVAMAAFPWVVNLVRTVEQLWTQYEDVILAFINNIPNLLAKGWDWLITTIQEFLQYLPAAVQWFKDLAETGRTVANVMIAIAEALAKLLGLDVGKLPRIPKFPWPDEKAPPGRQHGGTAHPGEPVTVGEQGPEIFTPDTEGDITPSGFKPEGSEAEDVVKRVGTRLGLAALALAIWPYIKPLLGRALKALAIGLVTDPIIAAAAALAIAAFQIGKFIGQKIIAAREERQRLGLPPKGEPPYGPEDLPEQPIGGTDEGEVPIYPSDSPSQKAWKGRANKAIQDLERARSPARFLEGVGRPASRPKFKMSHMYPEGPEYLGDVTQRQGQQVQRHEIKLLLPPPLTSEVAALEVAENVRLIFASTVS